MKSSQFHGSRRNVKSSMQKPLDRILMRDSKVYIPVKVYLKMGMVTQGMLGGGGSPLTSTQCGQLGHLSTYGDNPAPPLTAVDALSAPFSL